jgi:hypothetical protein
MGDSLPYIDLGSSSGVPFTVQQLAVGRYHACAVLNTFQIKCWGANEYGQLGYGDAVSRGDTSGKMGNTLGIVDLGTGYSAKQVALGLDFSCALMTSGAVKCWGSNRQGQLGLEFASSREVGDGSSEMGKYVYMYMYLYMLAYMQTLSHMHVCTRVCRHHLQMCIVHARLHRGYSCMNIDILYIYTCLHGYRHFIYIYIYIFVH